MCVFMHVHAGFVCRCVHAHVQSRSLESAAVWCGLNKVGVGGAVTIDRDVGGGGGGGGTVMVMGLVEGVLQRRGS